MKERPSAAPVKLGDLREDALVERLIRHLPPASLEETGPGDDCAVLSPPPGDTRLLLKTDCLIETVHFSPDTPGEKIGWKAMARTLSDIAAMGGVPVTALVTIAAAKSDSLSRIEAIYNGLTRAAKEFNCGISGGETSSSPGTLFISVMLLGQVEPDRCILRGGARNGDRLLVTGHLGGAIKGRHLEFTPRLEEARWLTEHFPIHAMMDLSDGLAADLPRLAKASRLGFRLFRDQLPLHPGCTVDNGLNDGEDYELLLAVPPDHTPTLLQEWPKAFSLPLTEIGFMTRKESDTLTGGYDHFSQP